MLIGRDSPASRGGGPPVPTECIVAAVRAGAAFGGNPAEQDQSAGGVAQVLKYTARRLMASIPMLFILSILAFVVMRLAPGGPVAAWIGPGAASMSAEDIARITHNLGLDRPVHIQYLNWLGNLLKGDLGYSYIDGRPVAEIILQKIPFTLALTIPAFIIAVVVSVFAGVYSATHQYSFLDNVITTLCLGGVAVPNFWLCLMLMLVFCLRFPILPSAGWMTAGAEFSLAMLAPCSALL